MYTNIVINMFISKPENLIDFNKIHNNLLF